jgi:hypothetical protein
MVKLKNHLFRHGVFSGIAGAAGRDTVGCRVPNGVVNPVNAIVQNMSMRIFWSFNELGFNSTVKAILLSYFNKFIKRNVKGNLPVFGVAGVVLEKRFLRVGAKFMSGICVASIRNFSILLSNAPARSGSASLDAAYSGLKIFSAITFAVRKVVMRVVRITSRYASDGEASNAHTSVFGFCAFPYHVSLQILNNTINYTLVWDRFRGKPLAGLTKRRKAEHNLCMGAP